jgi:hypothetical protein
MASAVRGAIMSEQSPSGLAGYRELSVLISILQISQQIMASSVTIGKRAVYSRPSSMWAPRWNKYGYTTHCY